MRVTAFLVGDSGVSLWGLSSRERLTRLCRSLGLAVSLEPPEGSTSGDCLLLRCDYLFELRTIESLLEKPAFLLGDRATGDVAAAHVPVDIAASLHTWMRQQQSMDAATGTPEPASDSHEQSWDGLVRGDTRDLGDYDATLRRSQPPMLERLEAGRAAALEDNLYGDAYKGVTDLVTKWLWPRPAKRLVRLCAAWNISPNQVTSVSFLLVVASGLLFYWGEFALGLLSGWIMTLLDTVDGKLARVRVQSSYFGHLFDHGIDLIHPPFWYLLWALGLTQVGESIDVGLVATLIFTGYIAGRFAELAFEQACGGSLFAWRPFDSWFRLVTARRNPCLIILTLALMLDAPVAGLWGVAVWTVSTSVVLWLRVLQALPARWRRGGRLPAWFESPDAARSYPRSHRVFSGTRGAYRA